MEEKEKILVEQVRELQGRQKPEPENTAKILGEKRYLSEPLSADEARKKMASMTRRNFLIGGAAAAFGVLGWRWMSEETKASLLRGTLEFNERVSQVLYKPTRLAPEFTGDEVTAPRVNGDAGMQGEFDPASWKLTVNGLRSGDLSLSIDDIKALPRTDMIVEFKCIEGWSMIAHYAGVRFSDFAAKYAPENRLRYISMTTPDNGYYVGWDVESIMHPQTLLCYEMNGRPLTLPHGAPLRLASPTKYGIKQIKRIGRIEFTDERPRDFWAENGYDWYAGL
jgi:DMSO/TMAO reductase YedYZ molybdopterin-dependent catalytic subunit